MSMMSVVGRIMVLKHVRVPILTTCECVALYDKRDFVDVLTLGIEMDRLFLLDELDGI